MTTDVPDVNTADDPDEREPYCDRCDDTGWITRVSVDAAGAWGYMEPCRRCWRWSE